MLTVMVPLDGSPFAEQALPLATAIARRMGARLHLVRVRASLSALLSDDSDPYMEKMAELMESQLPGKVIHWVLTDDMGALQYPPPAADTVAKVLAHHASRGADLIVMSTHGRGGVRRAWLGSVADALLRIAPRPLLLVRASDAGFGIAPDNERMINHILITLDGSVAAEEVLPVARRLAESVEARVTLLRVTSPLLAPLSTDPADGYPMTDWRATGRRTAIQYLNRIAAQLREGGLAVEPRVIEELSPASAIVDYASTHAVDLVALATSGAGGIRRLLLGSVADYVLRNGQTPVLACNAKHIESGMESISAAAGSGADLQG